MPWRTPFIVLAVFVCVVLLFLLLFQVRKFYRTSNNNKKEQEKRARKPEGQTITVDIELQSNPMRKNAVETLQADFDKQTTELEEQSK